MGKRKKPMPYYYQKNIAQHIQKRYMDALKAARAAQVEREKREGPGTEESQET